MSSKPHPTLSLILVLALLCTYTLGDLCAVHAQQWPGEKVVLGVWDLTPGTGVTDSDALLLSDRLRVELARTDAFTVIERSQMKAILEEQQFQITGCVQEACAVEIGRLLGARNMIIGSTGKVGDTFTISLRMVDVETGIVDQTAHRDYRGKVDDLLTVVIPDLAKVLAGIEVRRSRGHRWLWVTLGVLGAGGVAAAVLAAGGKPPAGPSKLPMPPDRP